MTTTTTDVMRGRARGLANLIRKEVDLAGTDTGRLNDLLTAARDCEKHLQDARLYARVALREADA